MARSPGDGPCAKPRRKSNASSVADSPSDYFNRRSNVHHHHPLIGSPPAVDNDFSTSPSTPKRTERIFPISSVLNAPTTPGVPATPGNGSTQSTYSTRYSQATPSPYVESVNPFDGDRLYVNFNEELDRQRQNREFRAARVAAEHDTDGADNIGVLQHPMTMRFQHVETEEGHCVVTVIQLLGIYLMPGLERFSVDAM